ncbi:MAG: DNA-processing protein DprA [Candidatus Binatales bacterium]
MDISAQTQTVLLLTAHFSRPLKGEARPLSTAEWGRLEAWLKGRESPPESLLNGNPARSLTGWIDRTVTLERVQCLLSRAGTLGLAMEKWQRAGLWVLARSDVGYPDRLKKLLSLDSPPLLFGCGSRNLLNKGGIAVVGSRDAAGEDLAFASRLGWSAASQGLSIVSGGARGVDEAAMLGALEREGTVVGVVADGLLRAATSAKYRQGLMGNNLVLVSSVYPEAGFDVGNAMSRNKYIYCLSDAAIVVSSTRDRGGTWTGAVENLNRRWVPLWVKADLNGSSGNGELVRRGAHGLPDGELELRSLFASAEFAPSAHSKPELFDRPPISCGTARNSSGDASPSPVASDNAPGRHFHTTPSTAKVVEPAETDGLYSLFLRRLEALTTNDPATADQLLRHLDIVKAQLSHWLTRAVDAGIVRKLRKPVRYQWQTGRPRQRSIFGGD